MPSYLLENGRLYLNCAPLGSAPSNEFVALAEVERELEPALNAEFSTKVGTPSDVLAGFRGDLVLSAASQAAAVQAATDRLTASMRAVAPAARTVDLEHTSPVHWVRITPTFHQIIGYVYDSAGGQLTHWSYDHPRKPFRGYLCFAFTLREVTSTT
ncbi:MAG: hypothetical protein SGJ09_12520 [Phycisphaerae bacterium]|nr:hypothetical protein [Phycisphaerae bacterium]